MRECLAHLEKQGKLTKKFHAPFHRGKKTWKMEAAGHAPEKPVQQEEYSHY
jgi:hypothetical protein